MANLSLKSLYTDDELIARVQADERWAFDELYERYWDKLFVTACNRLGTFEAEDVVQDVMLSLWHKRKHLTLTSSLSSYLAVCVKYQVINWLARQKRITAYRSSELLAADAVSSTEDYLDLAELQNRLLLLTNALPEKCRIVFSLSRNDGLSQKEIAAKMQISENTVEYHLKKALKDIREGLKLLVFLFMP